jgi:uncharacterized protein YbcI
VLNSILKKDRKRSRAIADAIISYKKEYFGNGGVNEEVINKPSKKW